MQAFADALNVGMVMRRFLCACGVILWLVCEALWACDGIFPVEIKRQCASNLTNSIETFLRNWRLVKSMGAKAAIEA